MRMTGGTETLIFLVVLFNIPMLLRVLRTFSPLAIDRGASRFTGRYSGWRVSTFTGKVAAANAYTTTTTTTTYQQSAYSHIPDQQVTTRTDVHQSILLVDAAGRQSSFKLVNFGAQIFGGQVVTVCWADRGRKQWTFATLNHSTRRQAIPGSVLNKIAMPRHGLMIFWIFVSCFTIVGIPVAGAFALLNRRQLRRFGQSGVQPLWASTAAVASAIS